MLTDEEKKKSHVESVRKYNSTKPKVILIFNPKTEPQLCDWLKSQEFKATYIKKLVREDMKRSGC